MKSVARIRLVKTENPSTCVTGNCKVCRIAIAQTEPPFRDNQLYKNREREREYATRESTERRVGSVVKVNSR
jgi:hypothetical protein